MCSEECCQQKDHLLECSMFKSCKVKVDAKDFNYETYEPLYDNITALRVLALKNKNIEQYKEYMNLMDHMSEFTSIKPWMESHDHIVGKSGTFFRSRAFSERDL